MKSAFYDLLKGLFEKHSFADTAGSINAVGKDQRSVVFNDFGLEDRDTGIIICPLDEDDFESDEYEELDSYDSEPQYIALNDLTSVTFDGKNLIVHWTENGQELSDSFKFVR